MWPVTSPQTNEHCPVRGRSHVCKSLCAHEPRLERKWYRHWAVDGVPAHRVIAGRRRTVRCTDAKKRVPTEQGFFWGVYWPTEVAAPVFMTSPTALEVGKPPLYPISTLEVYDGKAIFGYNKRAPTDHHIFRLEFPCAIEAGHGRRPTYTACPSTTRSDARYTVLASPVARDIFEYIYSNTSRVVCIHTNGPI